MSQPPYLLHWAPDRASLIIRLALVEMGLPHRLISHDPDDGSLAQAKFRALNPHGLIPALETPDGAIFETGAILLWLADRHGRLAPAPHSAQRAGFLAWFFCTANSLHPLAMQLIYPERTAGAEAALQVLKSAHARVEDHLARFEALAQTCPAWLAADAPSILSLYLAVLLRWLRGFAADPDLAIDTRLYPALHSLLIALETRPALCAVCDDEGLGRTPFSDPQV